MAAWAAWNGVNDIYTRAHAYDETYLSNHFCNTQVLKHKKLLIIDKSYHYLDRFRTED